MAIPAWGWPIDEFFAESKKSVPGAPRSTAERRGAAGPHCLEWWRSATTVQSRSACPVSVLLMFYNNNDLPGKSETRGAQ